MTKTVDVADVLYVEENAVIADFPADMPLEDEVFAAVNERFEEIAVQPQVDTHISVLQMESPMNTDVFSRAKEAAEAGKAFDIRTWILVSDGIKKRALASQVGDIPGVETKIADTKAEAMKLATA